MKFNKLYKDMENKTIDLKLEIKQLDETGMIEGYGSVFGNADSYNEIVQTGAFNKSLKNRPAEKIKMLWQHDSYEPIGVWEEMKEDENGLYCKGRILINTSKGHDVYELLKNGAIDGLSIGYRTMDSKEEVDDGKRTTLLSELDLWEVSVVTFPSNKESLVTSVKNVDLASDGNKGEEIKEQVVVELEDDNDVKEEKSDGNSESQSDTISKWSMKEIDIALKEGFQFTNSGIKSLYSRLTELKSKTEDKVEDLKPEDNLDDDTSKKNVDVLGEEEEIAIDSLEDVTIVDGQTPEEETDTKLDKIPEELFVKLNDLMDEIKSFITK